MADNVVKHDQLAKGPLSIPSDKGEPPSQWASSTLNALGPVVSEPHPYDQEPPKEVSNLPPSIPATPGQPSIPGSYPTGHLNPQVLSQDIEYIKDTAINTLETAKDYIVSASGKVGEYLPKSMTAYLLHLGTDPTLVDDVSPDEPSQKVTPNLHAEPTNAVQRRPEDNTLRRAEDSKATQIAKPQDIPITDRMGDHNRALASEIPKPSPFKDTLSIDASGADADASTRTLLGSRVENRHDTSDAISLPPSSKNETDRPDLHHKEETKHIPTLPAHVVTAHTSGQEHPTTSILHHENAPKGRGLPDTPLNDTKIAPLDPEIPTKPSNATKQGIPDTPLKDSNIEPLNKQYNTTKGLPDTSLNDVKIAPLDPQTDNRKGLPDTSLDSTKIEPLKPQSAETSTSGPSTDTKPIKTTTTGLQPSNPTQIPKPHFATATANANTSSTPEPSSHILSTSPSKPGFMAKLKGEMKVLSGKLENNADKVEKGRAMMGKTAKN